ncbi:hypothetical protein UPYG_G00135880 [Umbra pygmaea]|uniref:Uncharacterized protein n=1 Tax=Umbra pygmaea TaxID=75934 RepID=A0ABD0WUR5_UMBPY
MDSQKNNLTRSPLHPSGLPLCSPKRRFVKLGRKQSDGSSQSGSSGSSTRSADSGAVIRQPSRSRIRRHTNRLSAVFQRGSVHNSSMSFLGLNGISDHVWKGSNEGSMALLSVSDALLTDDPTELSNQITAPGILKIFGSELCQGANYKSVLATTHSSAKELVKEALERYGLNKEESESYVLCDAIGYLGDYQWRTECFRVVSDNEKPLLLQSLWKPREGFARRFEIQRRASVEEKRSRDKDTVTAGINAQARKLQKSRSRVNTSLMDRRSVYVACAPERGSCGGQDQCERVSGLWRSRSEADLSSQPTEPQLNPSHPQSQHLGFNHDETHSQGHGKNLDKNVERNHKWNPDQNVRLRPGESCAACLSLEAPGLEPGTEPLCPNSDREREETESSDDNLTVCCIHPPHDCPYLLLLQGYSCPQDFIIYLLNASSIVMGSVQEEDSKVDFLIPAPDILPRHCHINRYDNNDKGGSTIRLQPCHKATITRNGETLSTEVELSPGDVIGMGFYYLFLFKDPTAWVVTKKVTDLTPDPTLTITTGDVPQATAPPIDKPAHCNTCISTDRDSTGSRELRRAYYTMDTNGRDLTLFYKSEHEDAVIKEVIAIGSVHGHSPALTIAFLLSVCLKHYATHLGTSDVRRLLLLITSQVQSHMWEHTKELASSQHEVLCIDPEKQQTFTLETLIPGLRSLVLWMSNALELRNYIQHQLPQTLVWTTHRDQGQDREEEHKDEEEQESLASLDMRSVSEEAMTVLEEVIKLTFQQCVYYLTKALYPILPSLLDCESSSGSSGSLRGGGVPVSGETQQVLEVLRETRRLLQDCQLHWDISCQLLAYLFYFINASLFNTLMDRGSEVDFYHWSRGVSIRANLDLLQDWANLSGLGDLALEYLHTLSSAVNLLATPRKQLLQSSWVSLRRAFPSLSPAQLHHLLTGYSPATPWPPHWDPSNEDQLATHKTADILERFDSHPPLVLPSSGFSLWIREEVPNSGLDGHLKRLQDFIHNLSVKEFKMNSTHMPQDSALATEAKLTKSPSITKAFMQTLDSTPAEKVLPQAFAPSSSFPSTPPHLSTPSPPPPSRPHSSHSALSDLSSCGDLLSQKLKSLELQSRKTDLNPLSQRSALDPSCLLTPPNTPHTLELFDLETERQEGGVIGDMSHHEEEGDDEEVFTLELERGAAGLGLALMDARTLQSSSRSPESRHPTPPFTPRDAEHPWAGHNHSIYPMNV